MDPIETVRDLTTTWHVLMFAGAALIGVALFYSKVLRPVIVWFGQRHNTSTRVDEIEQQIEGIPNLVNRVSAIEDALKNHQSDCDKKHVTLTKTLERIEKDGREGRKGIYDQIGEIAKGLNYLRGIIDAREMEPFAAAARKQGNG